MKLYQFAYSPYAAKVRSCLAIKKLAYEIVEVPYMDRRDVVQLSGQVVVPVLVDGSTVVADSGRICAYLDERYAPSLRPTAAAVVFESWADGAFEDVAFRIACPPIEKKLNELNQRNDSAAMYRFVKERKFGFGCIDTWAKETPALLTKLRGLLAPIVRTLETQPFLLGDTPTLADAAVWGNFYMLEWAMPGWVAKETPEMRAWYERVPS